MVVAPPAGPEDEATRLAQNPSCDVCTATVTASAPHNFNGYDLLCEKCVCRKFVESQIMKIRKNRIMRWFS